VRATLCCENTLDVGDLLFRNVSVGLIVALVRIATAIVSVQWVPRSSPPGEEAARTICDALQKHHRNNMQRVTLAPDYVAQINWLRHATRLHSLCLRPASTRSVSATPIADLVLALIVNGIETLEVASADNFLHNLNLSAPCRLRHLAITHVPNRQGCTAVLALLHWCPELEILCLQTHSVWDQLPPHASSWERLVATLPAPPRLMPKLASLGLVLASEEATMALCTELHSASLTHLTIRSDNLTHIHKFNRLQTLVVCDWTRSSLLGNSTVTSVSAFDTRAPLARAYDGVCSVLLRACTQLEYFTLWFAEENPALFRSAHLPCELYIAYGPDGTILLAHVSVQLDIAIDKRIVRRTLHPHPHGDRTITRSRAPIAVHFT
jgi:hypothetical protein